jgi:hypothetical protein
MFEYETWYQINPSLKNPLKVSDESVGMDDFGYRAFTRAAQENRLFIIVRGINPGSLKYLTKKGYQPKLQDCKPKTAQHTAVQGLVVNPFANPRFFSTNKKDATKYFRDLVISQTGFGQLDKKDRIEDFENMSKRESRRCDGHNRWGDWLNQLYKAGLSRYGVETKGHYRGVVIYRRSMGDKAKWVSGDWDLKDVFKSPDDGLQPFIAENQFTPNLQHFHSPYFPAAQKSINQTYNKPVINHGDEVNLQDHVEDELFVFGPTPESLPRILNHLCPWSDQLKKQSLETCVRLKGEHNIRGFYRQIGRNISDGFRWI